MNYPAMKAKTITVKPNGGAMKNPYDERENQRLRELLRQAVNKENAPAGLREKISRLIRE